MTTPPAPDRASAVDALRTLTRLQVATLVLTVVLGVLAGSIVLLGGGVPTAATETIPGGPAAPALTLLGSAQLATLVGAGLVALVGGFWLVFAVSAVLSIIGGLMHLPIVAARNRPSGGEPCVAWGRSAPHPDRITWICHHVP